MIARAAMSAVLRRTGGGRLEIVDESAGGRRHVFGPERAPLQATIVVHDASFWRGFTRGSLGLAETYADGAWDCDDLVTLVRIGARDMPRVDRLRAPFAPLTALLSRVPRNTRSAARRHISAHYDLGNDMFELFLDETMSYSCARWDEGSATLEEAQLQKIDDICRKLELTSDDHLLEIGTGWGSLAMHAAGQYGCRVTTTTISAEQRALAMERIRAAGLEGRIEVLECDYRELRGRYDKLVSVEMIEAVGWQYFERFFRPVLGPARARRSDAAPGDHRRRPRLRGREGLTLVHQAADLPLGLPALTRGDLALHGPRHRHAHGRPRGHHRELPAHAGPLA